ncbi:myotrophin homolog isoform X2 [Musca autumnalis]|uniref:myotrophin homolog isoform X2 n=1 Tax=Musca autumnalis TaxID=221902 RepID=UPI003CF318C7
MSIKRNNNLNVDDVCKITSKKHTLDSDEEDSDEYERDDVDDVDGEEDGVPNIRDDIKITPFNMREELEEGHFDKEGHYHWDKNSDIRDNWLDNIDWMKSSIVNSEYNGRYPMHYAADYGQHEVLEYLIKMGAHLNVKDKHGITPLLAAIWEGHTECVKLLLEKGADKNGETPDGKSYAEAAEKEEIRKLLL